MSGREQGGYLINKAGSEPRTSLQIKIDCLEVVARRELRLQKVRNVKDRRHDNGVGKDNKGLNSVNKNNNGITTGKECARLYQIKRV